MVFWVENIYKRLPGWLSSPHRELCRCLRYWQCLCRYVLSEWEDRTGNYLPKVLFTLRVVLHDLERNIFSCGQTSLSRGAFYRMAVSFSLLLFPRGGVDRTVVPFSGPTSAIACELRKKKKKNPPDAERFIWKRCFMGKWILLSIKVMGSIRENFLKHNWDP